MINTVVQGVLGRNRSLSVDGLLRSARTWAWSLFSLERVTKIASSCCSCSHSSSVSDTLELAISSRYGFRSSKHLIIKQVIPHRLS